MAPHTAELPSWQLPAVGVSPCYGAPPTWNVVFLCALEEGQRREILDKLCTVDKTWTEDRPAADCYTVQRLIEVPWFCDSEPSSASIPPIVFQIYRAMRYPNSLIFIDRQSIVDGTAIIFNGEAARVPVNRAVLALSLALQKAMAEVLPDFESVKIVPEGSSVNTLESDKIEMIYRLPYHLPLDLKLEISTLSLISLVHIPDEKINEIKAEIGSSDTTPHVVIYNWPADQEPCSRAKMYRIFQATKPPYHEDLDETFSMFIDYDEMHDGQYCIIVAHEMFSAMKPIFLNRLRNTGDALQFWDAIWNPFEYGRRGTRSNNARVNTTIFDGSLRSRTLGFEVVSCPDNLAFARCDFCCFILSQMTETQFRYVRQELFSKVEGILQFVDVSKLIKTPDIQGLMGYFESDEYVKSGQQELPFYFLAIDDRTLKGVVNKDHKNLVIAADKSTLCVNIQDDDYNCYHASWSPGYAYSRLDASSAVDLCINLSCANMDFVEFCHNPEYSYWSVFHRWKEMNEDMIKKELELGRIDLKGSCRNLENMSA